MKSRKSIVSLLMVFVMVIVVGCSGKKEADKPLDLNMKSDKTFEFVDSAGRTVTLPRTIKRIAPSGTMAQIMLFALAPDEMVGLSGKWATSAELVLDEKYLNLPVFGQFYGSKDLNMEALAAAHPQVIIDIGEAKDSIAEDMDQIAEAIALVIKEGEAGISKARAIVQKLTDKYVDKVDKAVDEKCKEIMTV